MKFYFTNYCYWDSEKLEMIRNDIPVDLPSSHCGPSPPDGPTPVGALSPQQSSSPPPLQDGLPRSSFLPTAACTGSASFQVILHMPSPASPPGKVCCTPLSWHSAGQGCRICLCQMEQYDALP